MRRTNAQMQVIRDAIEGIVEEGRPMTVRQVFYQLVAKGVIPKTEAEYKGTVSRLLTLMRRDGTVDWEAISDNTRWARRPVMYTDTSEALEVLAESYNLNPWTHQDTVVEVWLEKDALAGVVLDATYPLRVALCVSRGYASQSFLWSAAQDIMEREQRTVVLTLTDWDLSGQRIEESIAAGLREHSGRDDIEVRRLGLTEEQAESYGLPTRPTKAGDRGRWGDRSVDLDALHPSVLRGLVTDAVEEYIDWERWNAVGAEEAKERAKLRAIARQGA